MSTRIKLNSSYWKHGYCLPFSEDVVPSSLFLKHRDFLILDVETQKLAQEVGGWDFVHLLGISIACAYDSQTDSFLVFHESEIAKLIELCEQRLVVGYNIRGFDFQVMRPYGLDLKKIDYFDILYDLEILTRQRYLKLEAVARGTLGLGKSADGVLAVEWWRAGEVQKIIDYCLQDVRVTRDIFQFGRQKGYIGIQRSEGGGLDGKSSDKRLQVPVQWN